MIQRCGPHLKRGIPEENPIGYDFLACELRSRPARLDSLDRLARRLGGMGPGWLSPSPPADSSSS